MGQSSIIKGYCIAQIVWEGLAYALLNIFSDHIASDIYKINEEPEGIFGLIRDSLDNLVSFLSSFSILAEDKRNIDILQEKNMFRRKRKIWRKHDVTEKGGAALRMNAAVNFFTSSFLLASAGLGSNSLTLTGFNFGV